MGLILRVKKPLLPLTRTKDFSPLVLQAPPSAESNFSKCVANVISVVANVTSQNNPSRNTSVFSACRRARFHSVESLYRMILNNRKIYFWIWRDRKLDLHLDHQSPQMPQSHEAKSIRKQVRKVKHQGGFKEIKLESRSEKSPDEVWQEVLTGRSFKAQCPQLNQDNS